MMYCEIYIDYANTLKASTAELTISHSVVRRMNVKKTREDRIEM